MRAPDTERALLTAIANAPDEVTPRLAHTDLPDERGDPTASDRASFIRFQVSPKARRRLEEWFGEGARFRKTR